MNDRTDREFLEYIHNKMLWKIVSIKEFGDYKRSGTKLAKYLASS